MKRPNVFIILLDTLRRDRLGAYGCSRDTSPNIDRFAADAAVFENAYTSAPWTLPAHTSLFTGLACEEHGVTSDLCTLDEKTPTLAQLLADEGYRCIGYSGNPFVSTIYGLARGFDHFINAHELRTDVPAPADWPDAEPTEHDKGGADIVRRFSADLRAASNDPPIFAFFNLTEPHHPYYPPTPYRLRYWRELGGFDTATVDAALAASELNFNVMTNRVALNHDGFRLLNAWYDGGVRYADQCVGGLLDAIRASGRAEHAMIVIMSDHGELLGERGIVGHTWSVLDPVARIPLIIKFAGERSPSNHRALVQTQDVFATTLSAAGIRVMPNRCLDLAELAASDSGRPFAIIDRARLDNEGLTFQLLKQQFAEEYADPHNPIHLLIHPRATLRKVVDAERKVILRISETYQQLEFESGALRSESTDQTLRWIRDAYARHYGHEIVIDSVNCRPQPGFDFMNELRKAQVTDRLRNLGYIE